jgi:hypothetical protein
MPFDIIAYKNNLSYRIQVKYTDVGLAAAYTAWADKSGTHIKKYKDNDFDYFALYLPQIDKVIYPSISFRGSKIRATLPDSSAKFYWWEDFVNFTDSARKRSYKEFGYELTSKGKENLSSRKVIRPSKEELTKLIWTKTSTEISSQFGVSDKAIGKWAASYKIPKPPRGYWMKKDDEQLDIKRKMFEEFKIDISSIT